MTASPALPLRVREVGNCRPGGLYFMRCPRHDRAHVMNIVETPPKSPAKPLAADLIARFVAIVGEKHAITDPQAQAPYLLEMRDMFRGHTPVVLRPGSVAEVAAILALANDTATPIVPQGGNTGLVGGQIPQHGEI